MQNLKIGTKVFMVHKKNKGGINGSKIIVGKVITFEYRKEKVLPIIKDLNPSGKNKLNIIPENYLIFDNQEEAIKRLMP